MFTCAEKMSKFHEHCGKNVKLSNGNKTATNKGDHYGGDNVAMSADKLTDGVPFLVKIGKTSSDKVCINYYQFKMEVLRFSRSYPVINIAMSVNLEWTDKRSC